MYSEEQLVRMRGQVKLRCSVAVTTYGYSWAVDEEIDLLAAAPTQIWCAHYSHAKNHCADSASEICQAIARGDLLIVAAVPPDPMARLDRPSN